MFRDNYPKNGLEICDKKQQMRGVFVQQLSVQISEIINGKTEIFVDVSERNRKYISTPPVMYRWFNYGDQKCIFGHVTFIHYGTVSLHILSEQII